jgi:large subunit ribosomal protein L3
MAQGLLGKKLGMTQLFTDDGRRVPVTLLEAAPCTVIQRKTQEDDGYEAVQVGAHDAKESRCTKPMLGHFAKAGVAPKRRLREFRAEAQRELKPGDELRVDVFEVGELVDVSGTSKGKGFAGVQKRHGMKGGPGTHGSNFHRAPGSIGMSADPSEVEKGKRLPGHMGGRRVTVRGLEVLRVDVEKNLLVVRGAVPGANGGLVEVKKSLKAGAR